MPIRKSRPVLYEMIRSSQRGRNRAGGAPQSRTTIEPQKPSVPETSPAPTEAPTVAKAPVSTVSPTTPETLQPTLEYPSRPESSYATTEIDDDADAMEADDAFEPTEAEKLFDWRVRHDPTLRVAFSLGWPGIAISTVGLMVLLFVAFFAGTSFERGRGAPSDDSNLDLTVLTEPPPAKPRVERPAGHDATPPANNTPATRTQTPVETQKPTASESKPPPVTEEEEAPPPQVALHRGYFYLVVQHFPKSRRQAADDAARFLTESQIPCALSIGKDIRLIATERFDLNTKDAAVRRDNQQRVDALKRRVRDLGKKYSDQGYAFDNSYVFEAK